MHPYPKIETVFKRDPATDYKTLLEGQWARPEFEYLKDVEWVFTEKIDGTNIRVAWSGAEPPLSPNTISFYGRSDDAQMPPFLLSRLESLFGTGEDAYHKFLGVFGEHLNVCLYGEGYGARIQKGGGNYIPHGVDFILFDVKVGDVWLERHNVEDIAAKIGVQVVPVVDWGCLEDAVELARSGFRSKIAYADIDAEGLVMRPKVELADRRGHRIITKIKHRDFVQNPGKAQ